MNFRAWTILLAAMLAGIAAAAPEGGDTLYLVKPGDTLMSIASEQLAGGARDFRRLAAHNGLKDANAIAPGAGLRIPAAWLRRQASQARVLVVAGEVKSGERVLKSGDTVGEGERLLSGASGYAMLEFADHSVVHLKPASELAVEVQRAAPARSEFETRLRLGAGAIEAVVAKPRVQQFHVRTPTADLAVRGAAFRARSAEGGTQVEVTEGRVAIGGGTGRDLDVDAGFGTVTRPSEGPAAPVRLLAAPDLAGVAERQERPSVRIAFARLPGAVGYRIVAATDAEMRSIVAESALRSPTARLLNLRDGDYFYTVRGVDALGLEGLEARGRFRLRARPLPPALAAPARGAAMVPGAVEFRWDAAEEGATYRFQMSVDERFANVLLDRAGVAGQSLTAQVQAAGRYFWRVASQPSAGESGPFGDPEMFVVREADPER